MAIDLTPLPLPASADPSYFVDFGREVKGVNPGSQSNRLAVTAPRFEFVSPHRPTSTVPSCSAMFALTPEQQYALTKVILSPVSAYRLLALCRLTTTFQAFDPQSESYGHGNNKTQSTAKSILHPDLKTIPRVPQVQLIGNGTVTDHEGLSTAALKHPSHTTFHKTRISEEDEAKGYTRFYRWHIDAALYDYNPPRVTTLYGITVPKGDRQTVRYDDGTGDELPVPLGTTAFVSGKTMFQILSPELKSLAVRASVRYAPHPYVWMTPARALPTGLGIESEGLEIPTGELPEWEESKVKTFPMLSDSCGKTRLRGTSTSKSTRAAFRNSSSSPSRQARNAGDALYPDGVHIKDLAEVRALLYKMQRPAIAPQLVYPHDWQERDLVLFHNRGLLHTVVGAFEPDQVRAFHQCNLAASDVPAGPNEDDVLKWA
ncbi:taurine catabolism dioxygenase TauD, TfdA family-domain-containing protein [Lanmaoa asiatica]|nr:taurine catabolism dioxygenase TauD, TfdA family-domain-containing protein [Lanmaoa asiatica]